MDAIEGSYSAVDINVEGRGSMVPYWDKWGANLDFADAAYTFLDLGALLTEKGVSEKYYALSDEDKSELGRLYDLRQELAQETMQSIGPMEYCRSVFYRIATELQGRLQDAKQVFESINCFTFDELSVVAKDGKRADKYRASAKRRMDAALGSK